MLGTIYGMNTILMGIATVIISSKEGRVELGWFACTIQLLIVTLIFIEMGV